MLEKCLAFCSTVTGWLLGFIPAAAAAAREEEEEEDGGIGGGGLDESEEEEGGSLGTRLGDDEVP